MAIDKTTRKQITEGIDRMEGSAGVSKMFRKHIPQPWRDVIADVVIDYYDNDFVVAGTHVSYLALGIFDNYIAPPPAAVPTPISQQNATEQCKTLELTSDIAVDVTNSLIEELHGQNLIIGNYFLVYGPDHTPENANKLVYDDYAKHLSDEEYFKEFEDLE